MWDAMNPKFVKSSASGTGGCVGVRMLRNGVKVRDLKDENGPVLSFTRREWNAFLRGVRDGEFDCPSH